MKWLQNKIDIKVIQLCNLLFPLCKIGFLLNNAFLLLRLWERGKKTLLPLWSNTAFPHVLQGQKYPSTSVLLFRNEVLIFGACLKINLSPFISACCPKTETWAWHPTQWTQTVKALMGLRGTKWSPDIYDLLSSQSKMSGQRGDCHRGLCGCTTLPGRGDSLIPLTPFHTPSSWNQWSNSH